MSRSVHEILLSAFNEIKESHNLAVSTVHFESTPVRSVPNTTYHFVGVSIDCKPCTPPSN